MNTGEVTGLWSQDEMDSIVNDLRLKLKELGIPDMRDIIQQSFVQRVRDNLHIILCMSPVGD